MKAHRNYALMRGTGVQPLWASAQQECAEKPLTRFQVRPPGTNSNTFAAKRVRPHRRAVTVCFSRRDAIVAPMMAADGCGSTGGYFAKHCSHTLLNVSRNVASCGEGGWEDVGGVDGRVEGRVEARRGGENGNVRAG